MLKLKSNLHTHTTYSDGCGTINENILSAINRGFQSIGISDHSYTEYDDCCLKYKMESVYINEIRQKALEYSDRIEVFCGLELDSFSECEQENYDYIIGSVHCLRFNGEYYPVDFGRDTQIKIIEKVFNGNILDFSRAYYDEVVRHIEKTVPDIVGHFDLLTKYEIVNENDEEYKKISIDALNEVMKYCNRFEINTGGMARGYKKTPYPNKFLLEEILKNGGKVVITSDSHTPLKIDFGFSEAENILKSIGFTHVDILTKSGFIPELL